MDVGDQALRPSLTVVLDALAGSQVRNGAFEKRTETADDGGVTGDLIRAHDFLILPHSMATWLPLE